MFIDLKKYLYSENLSEKIKYSFKIEDFDLSGINPFVSPIEVEADLEGKNGSLMVDLDVSYEMCAPCDRCAEIIRTIRKLSESHVIVMELSDSEDADSRFILAESENFNLDELVYSDVVLDLPAKYLCSEDCRGLCPKCGKNLNYETCTCKDNYIDPRLEVLKQLLD